jgi:hypothetical protein
MELDKSRQDLPKARIPLRLLYGVLLRFYAIIICGLVLCGHFAVDRTWPSPFKFWLCIALGVAAVAHILFGPTLFQRQSEPVRFVISPLATLGVIGTVVTVGIFLAWVVID